MAGDLASLALRFMPEGERPDRDCGREHAADTDGRIGIVVAGDPEPVAALLQGADRFAIFGTQPPRAVAIVETVAEREYRARPVAHDRFAKPRQRRRRVVGRQQRAMAREARGLLEMQVGDREQPLGRPIENAGRIDDNGGAGKLHLRRSGNPAR